MEKESILSIKSILEKKSVKNGAWMYLLQIFNTIVPLLTLPYITRILGASQYGMFSIAINIITYFQVIVEYGFGMSATRKVVLANGVPKNLNYIFTSVLYSRCILVTVCFILTGIYTILNIENINQCMCLLVLMVALFGNCIQLNWLFQGLQQMQYISIINIIARTISVILIFIFVNTPDDLLLYCFLYSVSPFVSGLLGLFVAKRTYDIRFVSISYSDIYNEMIEGWYVFTTQLSSKVFGAIGITFLGIFAANSEVGIYSAIQKIPNLIILAWSPISQVMYPISSQKMHQSFIYGKQFVKKARRVFVPLFSTIALVVAIFSKMVVRTAFGKEYAAYSYWIIPLLLWMVLAINNNFSGIQTLLASGHDKEYSRCFQISVVITVILNFVLIYYFKGNGACLAPFLSEMSLAILLHRKVKELK